ncbi:hypothetical protein [Nocardia sp. NPDC049707]|uniref:hypothetical protein n=1 Tax=Nocardia sp. NPDC049707 TaxID=3154735 RepID=UPI0034413352
MKIALLFGIAVAILLVMTWIGNPFADDVESPAKAASSWASPPPAGRVDPPLPSGFPSQEFPPPLVEVPKGQPQPVPTRFGLTYTVPSSDGWRPSNDTVIGWSEKDGSIIAGYGAVSDYGYRYCPQNKSSTLAAVGVAGRNGIDIDAAAREEIGKAERIFTHNGTGRRPQVDIRGPSQFEISGRPAVRYTAVVTGLYQEHSCDPTELEFDIVATPAYFTSEVAVFMFKHVIGSAKALTSSDVDKIVKSLQRT